jgi:FMN-dependent NADH-azoreductase
VSPAEKVKVANYDAFLEAYQAGHPGDGIETIDVFTAALPSFDGLAVQAKYTILHGKTHTKEEAQAWKAVEAEIERFKSADKYVLATAMWNFNIPYKLKQYIDILVQPGYTFSYSPETGYQGLVKGKPMTAIYARGGEIRCTEGEAFDMQKKYIE